MKGAQIKPRDLSPAEAVCHHCVHADCLWDENHADEPCELQRAVLNPPETYRDLMLRLQYRAKGGTC